MKNDKGSMDFDVKQKPKYERPGKLLNLKDAIRQFVVPGMTLHLAGGFGGPSAAICEIIRQYWGKNPELILVQSTISGHALNLVHCNLVKKIICSACVDMSIAPRPSLIIRKAINEKRIEMENWSLCSLQQRLMAGAFGFPFIPTKSVSGSNIASENRDYFKEISDPFDSEEKTGIVKALNPDLSIVHAWAADPYGNTILSTPCGDDIWGTLASTKGVIVTAEKIVTEEFIKRYSVLVKFPGTVVDAVVYAPLGAHPFPFTSPGIEEFGHYEMDVDFLNELHGVSGNSETLDFWIKEWVLDCPDHDNYIKKLSDQRIRKLKEAGDILASVEVKRLIDEGSVPSEGVSPEELVLIVIAREIVKSVEKAGHKMILVGAGSRSKAAWLAYHNLKSKSYELNLITGNGQIGYIPLITGSILPGEASVRSSKMLTDTITTHGVFVGGRNNRCLSVLGAGQVDRYGNINSSRTSTGEFLIGSGGANDSVNSREVIITLNQTRDRFPAKLSFVTSRGDNVTTVISSMGIFRKSKSDEELCLTECFPTNENTSLEQKIKQIQDNCGWALKVSHDVKVLPQATDEESLLVRSLKTDT